MENIKENGSPKDFEAAEGAVELSDEMLENVTGGTKPAREKKISLFYCPYCGKLLPEGTKDICPYCGNDLTSGTTIDFPISLTE